MLLYVAVIPYRVSRWYWHLAKKMSRTSITVPEDLLEWFKSYCEKEKRSVSAQLQLMIESLKDKEAKRDD